jgi:hypothetical protein
MGNSIVANTNAETFETRKEAANKLAGFLKDNNKRLIVVAAPFGWGKDVIMRQALLQCGCPPHQTINIVNISDTRRLMEKLIGYNKLSNEELFNAERDFDYALDLIKRQFEKLYGNPLNCIIFFLNSSLNEDKKIAKPILQAITRLAESGFRCVIEMWDPIGLDYGRDIKIENIASFFSNNIPRLNNIEVNNWLDYHGFHSNELKCQGPS